MPSHVREFSKGLNSNHRVTIMKPRSLLPVFLLAFVASAPVPAPRDVPKPDTAVTGDYVEARTASVFAGACHYNGELVTEGRDAILAWNISRGSWKGVDLSGVRAIAALTSEQNLGDPHASRKCELVVDISATNAQAAAVADWLRSFDSAQLGQIVSTHRSTISFRHDDGLYTINADGYAAMTVQPMPNNECCTQPQLVWYNPLMPLEHRKVGYTQTASYSAGTVGDPWDRADENSAFYGSFSIAGR